MDEHTPVTRRGSLVRLGGLLAAVVGGSAWEAASSGAGTGPAAVATGAVSCVLAPELTEGPFYIPNEKVRRNITEGKPGTPLRLRLTVVDASSCKPTKGAAVDVWHADAGGVYSGEEQLQSAGQTFLRGVQRTDAHGRAVFDTIYPGWYPGRAVHIHVKVYLGGNVVHTGQFFFSYTVTDAAYEKAPYSARPSRTTRNADDSIYVNGGSKSLLALRKSGAGYVGAIAMGVHRA